MLKREWFFQSCHEKYKMNKNEVENNPKHIKVHFGDNEAVQIKPSL